MEEKARFTEKKVDQSWKEEVAREKGKPEAGRSAPPSKAELSFSAFLTSLAYQTLMHLGEAPHPETEERHEDLGVAKETIDLLVMLEAKTRGNRTPEEDQLIKSLLSQVQMKFVEKADRR